MIRGIVVIISQLKKKEKKNAILKERILVAYISNKTVNAVIQIKITT